MNLLDLPAEILLRIVYDIPSIQDKCQLLQTCTHFNILLSSHPTCWSRLDLSPFPSIHNTALLTFFKNCGISLAPFPSGNDSTSSVVSVLDISGCKGLSETMLQALSKTFTSLTELNINGYRLSNETEYDQEQPRAFEQLRDHVFQVRPSHDLSSMTMDLSKRLVQQLKIPFILILDMLYPLHHLQSLSMQYQELTPPRWLCKPFEQFRHIRYLDISSCIVSQPALQTLLRVVGSQLISLKMLNIDLTYLTILSLGQHARNLECLHLSCDDQSQITAISNAIACMKNLKDFRLTRMRMGSLTAVIEQLNVDILERLDLSPKMNIYLKPFAARRQLPGQQQQQQQMELPQQRTNKHPIKTSVLPAANYATIEHSLRLVDEAFPRLFQCQHLVELRLCFPAFRATTLHQFCRSVAGSSLEIFELRLKTPQGDKDDDNYSLGIPLLVNLKELYLYSVYLPVNSIRSIGSSLKKMTCLTISDGGKWIEKTELQAVLLRNLPLLRLFRLGKLSRPISTWPEDVIVKRDNQSNIVFIKSYPERVWCVQ
ncbi:hypothetical protein CU097_005842 [Rhizopus azygosporus]|uniref:F-box domain-containing protein n=1 Tax=Rhizopus azygosporus TaxID=86630 RepID=A0A367JFL1_RHIAZ|nr:hypothetical protein CU097_005842 [Rhizopus azygosporus]